MPRGRGQLKVYNLRIREQLQLSHGALHDVVMDDLPFASGGCREAFHCVLADENGRWGPQMVAKRYIRSEAFLEDYVCAHYANECACAFNNLQPPKTVDYLIPNQILSLSNQNYSIERFLPGDWQKHNNIFGMILSDKTTPNAFSHFTYLYSKRRYIILDVQGVGETFTDPAVVSVDQGRFGYTDTGLKGIRDFFRNHVCNEVCHSMGLSPITGTIADDVTWEQVPRLMNGTSKPLSHREVEAQEPAGRSTPLLAVQAAKPPSLTLPINPRVARAGAKGHPAADAAVNGFGLGRPWSTGKPAEKRPSMSAMAAPNRTVQSPRKVARAANPETSHAKPPTPSSPAPLALPDPLAPAPAPAPSPMASSTLAPAVSIPFKPRLAPKVESRPQSSTGTSVMPPRGLLPQGAKREASPAASANVDLPTPQAVNPPSWQQIDVLWKMDVADLRRLLVEASVPCDASDSRKALIWKFLEPVYGMYKGQVSLYLEVLERAERSERSDLKLTLEVGRSSPSAASGAGSSIGYLSAGGSGRSTSSTDAVAPSPSGEAAGQFAEVESPPSRPRTESGDAFGSGNLDAGSDKKQRAVPDDAHSTPVRHMWGNVAIIQHQGTTSSPSHMLSPSSRHHSSSATPSWADSSVTRSPPQGRLALDHEVAAALTGGLNGGGLPAPGAPSSPVPAPAAFSPPRNGFHPATSSPRWPPVDSGRVISRSTSVEDSHPPTQWPAPVAQGGAPSHAAGPPVAAGGGHRIDDIDVEEESTAYRVSDAFQSPPEPPPAAADLSASQPPAPPSCAGGGFLPVLDRDRREAELCHHLSDGPDPGHPADGPNPLDSTSSVEVPHTSQFRVPRKADRSSPPPLRCASPEPPLPIPEPAHLPPHSNFPGVPPTATSLPPTPSGRSAVSGSSELPPPGVPSSPPPKAIVNNSRIFLRRDQLENHTRPLGTGTGTDFLPVDRLAVNIPGPDASPALSPASPPPALFTPERPSRPARLFPDPDPAVEGPPPPPFLAPGPAPAGDVSPGPGVVVMTIHTRTVTPTAGSKPLREAPFDPAFAGGEAEDSHGELEDSSSQDAEPEAHDGALSPLGAAGLVPPPVDIEPHMSARVREHWGLLRDMGRAMFLKYGRKGSPHRRYFSIEPRWDGKQFDIVLVWQDIWDNEAHGEVVVGELEGVDLSPAAKKFQRHLLDHNRILGRKGQVHDSSLCFTLTFAGRSLDLLALSRADFDRWTGRMQTVLAANQNTDPTTFFVTI